ncbi:Exopolygalacturonase X-2 [Fusarium euwallaceae]|uniref:galacturonan 1,4-alpha-galacturonidase n=2 Tax=Fusarium solani species complex TaxID=232080 RepID=A0A430LT09_9HYPO|nr:Exopolygalacturonase X-2 [Fusarium floridanum]RTE78857.1 Exopolygalacturonase X-2 [Fusarium euwallaceae]
MLLKPTIVLAFLALAELIDAGGHAPKRPHHEPTPLQPYKAFPTSSPRRKTCFVKPGKKGGDDSSKILRAFKKCNNGGTVVLDQEYTICTQLDLRFLKHVDIALTGTVKFCDDVERWLPRTFQFPFQDGSSWWLFGGEDINLYGAGTGTIDGNGQAWYDAHAADSKVKRPLLFVTDGWKGGSITGLKLRQSPNWHNLIANSSDILISDIDIFSRSTSNNFAKNLDGWDTYRSDNIVIQNSYIDHDDDCVSFKPNSTNIIVQGLVCNSSHGISVGSLGQYPGVFDNIENLYIYNISMSNATDGARLKVWPGADVQKPEGWIGGGGEGRVRNVTYERFFNDNNDGAIKIDQCYGAVSAAECEADPSKVILTDILFKDFWGTVSKKNDPVVGSLICSSEDSCDNIRAENVTVTPPSGKDAKWACRNMDEELLDLNGVGCVDA